MLTGRASSVLGCSVKELLPIMSVAWVAWGLLETFFAVWEYTKQLERPDRSFQWVDGYALVYLWFLPVLWFAMLMGSWFARWSNSVGMPWMVGLGVEGALVSFVLWLAHAQIDRRWRALLVDAFQGLIWTMTYRSKTRQRFVQAALQVLAEPRHPVSSLAAVVILRMEGRAYPLGDPVSNGSIYALEASLWAEALRCFTDWPGWRPSPYPVPPPAFHIIDTLNVLGWTPHTGTDLELVDVLQSAYRQGQSLEQVLEARSHDLTSSDHQVARDVLVQFRALKQAESSPSSGVQAPDLELPPDPEPSTEPDGGEAGGGGGGAPGRRGGVMMCYNNGSC